MQLINWCTDYGGETTIATYIVFIFSNRIQVFPSILIRWTNERV